MDLGYKPEPPEEPVPTSEKTPETRYPSLNLENGSVDALKGDHQCAVGDEYYADGVRLRVKSVEDSEYGKRLSFDVLSIDDFEPTEAEPGEEDEPPDSGKKSKSSKALRYAD